MNLLNDIITYVRRIVKTPSNTSLSDNLIVDYINRFWIMDVDARMQLFDLKTHYQFQTIPGIDQYNMPLYEVQQSPPVNGNILQAPISFYPVYQGFMSPARVSGINCPFYTQRSEYFNVWPNYVQSVVQSDIGDGSTVNFNLTLPFFPALPGHLDMTGIIATGSVTDPIFSTTIDPNIPITSIYPAVYFTSVDQSGNKIIVQDSGVFLSANTSSELYGLLMVPGNAPRAYTVFGTYNTTNNTVNYTQGTASVTFPTAPANGAPITAQCYFYQPGIPRSVLFNNNTLTLRPPPNTSYLVELDAYLTPAAFLADTDSIQFAYMAEYIARGAARKLLSDTGDIEQFQFYEPLFREQEMLVWKRSQRQFTATRTQTIYSMGPTNSNFSQSSMGV